MEQTRNSWLRLPCHLDLGGITVSDGILTHVRYGVKQYFRVERDGEYWERDPATNFGRNFRKLYRKANGIK